MAKISSLSEVTTLSNDNDFIVNDSTPTTKKVSFETLKSELGLPSRVLCGFISQSGTDAPALTIFKNTLGITPTTSYNNVGDYTIDFSTSTLNSSTIVIIGTSGFYPYTFQASYSSSTTIALKSFRDNIKYNNAFVNIPIKIEIYD